MVAARNVQAPQPPTPDPIVRRMGYGPVRFTVNVAMQMVEQGLLPEDARIELLDGALDDYRDRLPTAADVFCVVEVADSSYERDAGDKLAGYARAGIAHYVIVNLRNRTAEVYTNPNAGEGSYPPPRLFSEGESLPLRVGSSEVLDVELRQILP